MESRPKFTPLVPLPINRKASPVRDVLPSKVVELTEQLHRSLAWDQGKETAAHADFKAATDVAVYF